MILDTSAVVAILNKEAESEALQRALADAVEPPKIGAPTKVECGMVLVARLGIRGRALLTQSLHDQGVEVVEFSDKHADEAVQAFHRFGKGRHPARLNLGDCYSYASASIAREPLLCIGNDFAQTDLPLVTLPGV